MAKSEADELQELLAASSANHQTRPSRGDTPVAEKEEKPFTEWSQWQILPNGRFLASGRTDATLPVGAYTVNLSNAGPYFERKRILTDTLIDLDESNSLRVISGIQTFWTKRDRYIAKGILFKRGVLLWGPAGSGKTATIALLVENLIAKGGIVLLVQNPGAAILGLTQLRRIEPTRPLIVVLEDVEEIIASYGEHDLLALLDGEHQTDNVVNIASTNYPEALGARIVNRPSRFDEVLKIGMPSAGMREQYFWHILGDDVEKYPVASWVKHTEGMSIAHLKELVVAVTCLDQEPEEVINRLRTMKTAPKSQMYDGAIGFGLMHEKAAQLAGASSSR